MSTTLRLCCKTCRNWSEDDDGEPVQTCVVLLNDPNARGYRTRWDHTCTAWHATVEADTPTGIPADWTDCAQCGARRFYPSGQCMQYCDKQPSPPDAKDALLREAFAEALRRYGPRGDVEGALIFFLAATAKPGEVNNDDIAWFKARAILKGE